MSPKEFGEVVDELFPVMDTKHNAYNRGIEDLRETAVRSFVSKQSQEYKDLWSWMSRKMYTSSEFIRSKYPSIVEGLPSTVDTGHSLARMIRAAVSAVNDTATTKEEAKEKAKNSLLAIYKGPLCTPLGTSMVTSGS